MKYQLYLLIKEMKYVIIGTEDEREARLMSDFNAAEYKKELEESQSCETCRKVPHLKIGDNTRYIFISYSHKDYKKVYSDLADMYESDIPFWYDSGLPAGKNWDDVVREKMTDPRCAGIIFYLSENLFLSRSIQTEIKIACGEDADSSMPKMKRDYFSVNIADKMPSEIVKSVFLDKQFNDTDDEMTARSDWMKTLSDAFPDKATYLTFSNPNHKMNLVEQIGVNFNITPNYNPYDFGKGFFRSGNAVIEFKNGAVYNGEFSEGLFEGRGKMAYSDGHIYKGGWKRGKRHGQGKMIYSIGDIYEGGWIDGRKHGQGKYIFSDGTTYEGEWKDGKRHGQGKATYPDGVVYEGEWKDENPHGQGKIIFSDGDVYEGDWKDGEKHGQGKYIFSDGTTYEGEWKDGEMHGQGKMTLLDGTGYEGEWKDEEMHGQGKMIYSNGAVYEGDWKDGEKHGQGKYTFPDGEELSGIFENGEYIGPAE